MALRVSMADYSTESWVTNLPLYAAQNVLKECRREKPHADPPKD